MPTRFECDPQGQLAARGTPAGGTYPHLQQREGPGIGKWAEMQGKGDVFRRAVYRAFFVEGRNIAPVDELALIAEAFGLPGDRREYRNLGKGRGRCA